MFRHFWDWTRNPAVFGPVCGLIGTLVAVFIGPSIKAAVEYIWDWIKTHFSGRYFENIYLEWLIAENQYLPSLPTTLVPVTEGHRNELDQLYVSLSVSGEHRMDASVTRSLGEALKSGRKIVVLGEPGSGKTTMLKFLALTFARARRNHADGENKQERRESEVRTEQARKRVRQEFGFKHTPLPIFVLLNRLRDVNSWERSRSLLDHLREELRSVEPLRNFPTDFFDKKLQSGECTFLFDAFDELGTEDARAEIARRVGELANAAPPGNRFVVTSRIVGYSGQLAQYGFRAFTVNRLSSNQIGELVNKWYTILEEPALSGQLLQALEANPRIRDLAVNPMLLSLIVLVQYVHRLIPDRRDLLYDTCVAILIERRYAPVGVQQAFNQVVPADDARLVLQKIARNLHDQHLREVPRRVLEAKIVPEIIRLMRGSRAGSVSPPAIVRNIEERSQLLIERGLDSEGHPVMAFSHLTFQEYLTSVDLKNQTISKGFEPVVSALLAHYEQDRDWWEEVALLFAAQLEPADRAELLHQLSPRGERNFGSGGE
jgi:predicted NACHT family NTPase